MWHFKNSFKQRNMKKLFKYITASIVVAGSLTACHKVGVDVTSELTADNYPKTDAQFASAMGPVYIALRADYATTYFFLQSQTTDESVLPIFATDWVDGNRYLELHRHTWTKDNPLVNSGWSYLTNMIGTTNQTISIIQKSPDGATKNTSIAELRAMRALAYFMMMDMYGNVPLDTVYPSTELRTNTPRAQVFNFVESELKAVIPNLRAAVGTTTYGKPTRYMAYALLAKMYLNAQVYTGTARNNECIAACDSVIKSGLYGIEPRASYLQMFYPTNGANTKEFIFAIPYDPSTAGGNMFYGRYDLNRNLGIRYRYSGSTPGSNIDPVMNKTTGGGLINNKPSGPRMTTDQFYENFRADSANDIRNKQWLAGKQYWEDDSAIYVETTNLNYDQYYSGSDKNGVYKYHLTLYPLLGSRLGAGSYDLGKDEIAWNTGYRNIKFYPDANSITRNQSNDVPILRYSDILLMKAEAILRGGTPTMGHTAVSLVNMVRSQRTTSPDLASVTLDFMYAERSREFAWELWHRNDMIRFGKYEGSWGLGKTNAEPYRRIFPIPTTAFATNGNLKQNDGYQ
jgi:hypothetical protein